MTRLPQFSPRKEKPLQSSTADTYPEIIRATIKRDGFSVQTVLGDAKTPIIAYTLGFVETRNAAEFIVLHRDDREAYALLKGVAEMVRGGVVFSVGAEVEGLDTHPVRVIDVAPRGGLALCPVFRWIYPDKKNVKFYQLLLGERSEGAPAARSNLFPASGTQDVSAYLARTRTLGIA